MSELLEGKSEKRTFSLPKRLSEALTARAKAEDRGASRIVRRALVAYLTTREEVISDANQK